jgi:hypothetical protein
MPRRKPYQGFACAPCRRVCRRRLRGLLLERYRAAGQAFRNDANPQQPFACRFRRVCRRRLRGLLLERCKAAGVAFRAGVVTRVHDAAAGADAVTLALSDKALVRTRCAAQPGRDLSSLSGAACPLVLAWRQYTRGLRVCVPCDACALHRHAIWVGTIPFPAHAAPM